MINEENRFSHQKGVKMPVIVKKSVRLRLFQLLQKSKRGLTSIQIKKALRVSPTNGFVGVILRGELASRRLKVEILDMSGRDAIYYSLTRQGITAIKSASVDSQAKRLHLNDLGRESVANHSVGIRGFHSHDTPTLYDEL